MGAIAVPIQQGKLDVWEGFMSELNGPRKAEFDDMNQRFDVTGHRAWLQHTPDGHQMVIAVHDGPGADGFMGKLGSSEDGFDVWFRGMLQEVHGIDLSGPLPPPAEQRL